MNIESEIAHCKHFVKRKKRYCRMTLKEGHQYCGEHEPSSDTISDSIESNKCIRIVCPLDNKHTCYAHKLSKHLKICNARQDDLPIYIQKDVNLGDGDVVENNASLSTISAIQITDLVKRINKIYEDYVKDNITSNILKHEIVEKEIAKPEYGSNTKKHLHQASSILGQLVHYNLFQNDTCFIEFGAGKGQLSYWVANASNNLKGSSVLLIERASHRHKYDNKLDKSEGHVKRIRADIADLVLNKVEGFDRKRVVGLTKHLCGNATDLALRCLINYENCNNNPKVSGIVMAFCCHHRCEWNCYTGKKFFQNVGLSSVDFNVMCRLVSWATCGDGLSRDKRNLNKNNSTLEKNIITDTERASENGLTKKEKEEIGRHCKKIINWGRLMFLKELGFNCFLHYYVDECISPENLCIVAFRDNF